MPAGDAFDTLKTVVAIIGGGGFFGLAGWLVSQARGWGRLERTLEELVKDVSELKTAMEKDRAEDQRSRESQGKRIGDIESEVYALKAVREALDHERSRPYSNVPTPVR